MKKGPKHVYQAYIRASRERVWEAITTPEFTRQYFHRMRIRSDWKPGSSVTFVYDDGRVGCEGRLLEFDPPRRLSYTWRFTFDEALAQERPSTVVFELETAGQATRLRIVHGDFDDDSKVYPMIREGWAEVVSSLKSLLETGEALAVAGNADEGTDTRGAA
jgi:uncharacterized protein YndB with AHSA1/START domain